MFNEPGNILSKVDEPFVEMSATDHGFLCGLIKEKNPKKIVEVGVAGGGTTAVVMNCLSVLNSSAKMFSVDISEQCYKKEDRKTGWQLEKVKDYLNNYQNHTFLLGKRLFQRINELGDDIDFLILDTEHAMPGEILDFLCILPHVTLDAVVVLHDTGLNLYGNGGAIATKILFDSVSGKKYFNFENSFPNIAAFEITEETILNIDNVFSALSITWNHLVNINVLMGYRTLFEMFYSKDCLKLFDQIVLLQYQHYYQNKVDIEKEKQKLHTICSGIKKIYLYGTGIRGKQLEQYILRKKYHIDGFVASDFYDLTKLEKMDRPVYKLSEIPENDFFLILATPAAEVFYGLLEKGIPFEYFSENFFECVRKENECINGF